MENAVDALKMAFAIFVFVIAVSVSLVLFSQAKITADHVLFFTDKTNFYTHHEESGNPQRTVGVDAVISSLYSCKRNGNIILVKYKCMRDGREVEFEYSGDDSDEEKEVLEEFMKTNRSTSFTEIYAEARTGGQYVTAEDETQIIVTGGVVAGTANTYITYTHTD